VARASEGFVRILIRRPHAYEFVSRYALSSGAIASADATGVVLVDGRLAPIPGLYVLDQNEKLLGKVSLLGSSAREEILRAMGEHR